MTTKKIIFAMVHAIYALNAVRNNQKTGSIVPRAIVISRTRHVSNFTLNYRPKATCHTIVAVSSPPQSIETNRDNRNVCENKYCGTCKMFMFRDPCGT